MNRFSPTSPTISPLGSDAVLDTVGADAGKCEILHDAVEEVRIDRPDGGQGVRGQLDWSAEPPELVSLLDHLYLQV